MSKLTAQEWTLYIGQKVMTNNYNIENFIGAIIDRDRITILTDTMSWDPKYCVPVLRDISQMTDIEKLEYSEKNKYATPIECHDWLTRKGFAIRGEFERGVAVMREEISK